MAASKMGTWSAMSRNLNTSNQLWDTHVVMTRQKDKSIQKIYDFNGVRVETVRKMFLIKKSSLLPSTYVEIQN